MRYLLLGLLWISFYTFQTFLSASKIKRISQEKSRRINKWSSIAYGLISFLILVGVGLYSLFLPKVTLMPADIVTLYLGYLLATFGTILIVRANKKISILRCIKSTSSNNLVTKGIYSSIRYPLYAGIILILLGYFLLERTMAGAIQLLAFASYIPIGTYFKEKYLAKKFEDRFTQYKKTVPAFLPKL